MVTIERMDLADIGNPVQLAKAVIGQIPNITLPIPVRDIAAALDIAEIKPITVSGFEGGLITFDDKSSGCILINENSRPQRQRFTIGHELGHYLNPWHNPGGEGQFMCKAQDMIASGNPTGRRQKMEVEANQFSAELLMPSQFMRDDIKRLNAPEIDHIVALSTKYDVSKESMGRRYIEFQDEPCALVFSRNGKLSYMVKGQYFPQLSVWQKGDAIPENSLTKTYGGQSGNSSDWREHASDIWLRNSDKYESVYEQVLLQENGYRITLLTLGNEVDEDEEELIASYKPRFR